jgi:plasmid stabilization system protein ParE
MRKSAKRHPLVRDDLRDAALWYENLLEGLGRRFNAEAIAVLKRLPSEALLYAVRFGDIPRVNLPSFPYGVFYFLHGEEVIVLGVLHGARETRAELERRRDSFR